MSLELAERLCYGVQDDFRCRSVMSRRLEVLTWLAAGKTTVETAIILGIARNTVQSHILGACAELGAVTRAQAIALAIWGGLLPAPPGVSRALHGLRPQHEYHCALCGTLFFSLRLDRKFCSLHCKNSWRTPANRRKPRK